MVRVFTRIKKKNKSIFNVFIGRFIKRGKRELISKMFLKVLLLLKNKKQKNINYFLITLFSRIKPVLGLRPKFSAGLVYMLPTFISLPKEKSLGLNWFSKGVKKRSINQSFSKALQQEISLTLNSNKSYTILTKIDYYRTIILNRDLVYRFRKH